MSADSRKPTLDDARARVSRAKEHIASLEREIAAALPPDQSVTSMVVGPAFVGGSTEYVSAPPILSILIGETIYNLRSALDYLVYELAYLDIGKPQYGTKFLIEDSIKGWNKYLPGPATKPRDKRKMWLHKLTVAHQAAIESLQPYRGCQWTGVLRRLSNPDKHSRLLTIIASVDQSGPGTISGAVMVTFKLTTKIAFKDGSLVVETLQFFHEQVADVIDAFDPDFQ